MSAAEPRTPRYLTEADCYHPATLQLGYFTASGPYGKLDLPKSGEMHFICLLMGVI